MSEVFNMNREIEKVDHHTSARPFGLYHITIHKEETLALYLHCHTENEVFLLTEGEVEFSVEQNKYILKAGDAIFVPPMLLHGATKSDTSECRFVAMVFATDMVATDLISPIYTKAIGMSMLACVYPIYKREAKNNRLLESLKFLPDRDDLDINSCELTIYGVLYMIWQELYNLCFVKVIDDRRKSYKEIDRVVMYIQEHYSENITLRKLAEVSGFSEGYFGHYFLEHMEISPFEYLNKVRIAHASRLLVESDKKITEIAGITGYNNISYFNRVFLKYVGTSPSKFRKRK